MSLNTKNWQRFMLGRLFVIRKGKRLTSEDREEGNNIYVGAIDSNNGVADYIGQAPKHKGNTISLSYNGSVGEAFYQPQPFWATDDVNVLYPRFKPFNERIGLFFVAVIRCEKYRFSYGRKWTLENMRVSEICLPILYDKDGSIHIDKTKQFSDDGYVPDFLFMEKYIKSLHHKPLSTANTRESLPELSIQKWGEFRVGDLFPKKRLKHFSAMPDISGSYPFISSTSANNGVSSYVEEETEKGNCITVSTNGDCFDCFYQPNPIVLSNDVEALYNAHLNKYNALFVITVLRLEKIKYGYGRKPKSNKVYDTIIKLPITKEGKPDWCFMENYIKKLPFGDRL